MAPNLLLLSSSRVGNTGYLEHALPHIASFLAEIVKHSSKLLFIPYAGISMGFDKYESQVKAVFDANELEIESIHSIIDKERAIGECRGIVVGGGNTFALLNSLYEQHLMDTIRNVCCKGKPYIGWSAGSNIATPNIRTTNDMPIVEPKSFSALNLLPWQINPHYIDGNPPGHNGETREQRLQEYLLANPQQLVIGLPEGTGLKYVANNLTYFGNQTGYIFGKNNKKAFNSSSNLMNLLEISSF